jgi:phospholipid/cholesterol/gamma-HCH transport system permease protein
MSARGEPAWVRGPAAIGAVARPVLVTAALGVAYLGGVARLLGAAVERLVRAVFLRGPRVRLSALSAQSYRFGVVSIPIVILVQVFIGVILALNLAPTLASYGQIERVADVVAIAVLRELGPLITAVLLSGFAGASIAAELGSMVEGEESKALRAHALDPVRFLVTPRVLATAMMTLGLTVLANVCGIVGGMFTGVVVLDLSVDTYLDFTRLAVTVKDYFTGLFKAFVFGAMIAGIACYEGLNVHGGAEGVGRATTVTVVKSIVALIAADCIFAGVFYTLGW